MVGRDGGTLAVIFGGNAPTSFNEICEGGDRTGEPLVNSESAEKCETGRGLPKLSRLNRSG